jgi:DNA-binding response OmpR family regulator
MVVDDDRSLLSLLLIFIEAGFDVVTCPDGQAALLEVDQDPPAAIVLDLEMPVMNGREFYRELRARSHAMPVLILSHTEHALPSRSWARRHDPQAVRPG